MKNNTEDNIIHDLKSEDSKVRNDAMRSLYESNYPVVKSFVTKNNGTESDAADIFQDAIIVFYEKLRKNELTLNCTIKTYIYSVCKYMWYNELKKNKKVVSFEENLETIKLMPNDIEEISNINKPYEIVRWIEQLGSKCKQVLTYYYYDRLKMKQIAIKMNLANEQVAKNKKSSCLKKLREMAFSSIKKNNQINE